MPSLLLILAGCYLFLGILGSLMICQPPEDWVQRRSVPTSEVEAQESEKKWFEKIWKGYIISWPHWWWWLLHTLERCFEKQRILFTLDYKVICCAYYSSGKCSGSSNIRKKKLKFPLCNNKNIYETANKKCIFFLVPL